MFEQKNHTKSKLFGDPEGESAAKSLEGAPQISDVLEGVEAALALPEEKQETFMDRIQELWKTQDKTKVEKIASFCGC